MKWHIFNTADIWKVKAECRRLGLGDVRLIKVGTLWIEALLSEAQATALAPYLQKQ